MTLNKIKTPIGEYDFRLVPTLPKSDEAHGMFEESKQLISIDSTQHPYQIRQTLIHELLHGGESCCNFKLKETEIDALAYYLLFILRNNPKLIDFLLTKDL